MPAFDISDEKQSLHYQQVAATLDSTWERFRSEFPNVWHAGKLEQLCISRPAFPEYASVTFGCFGIPVALGTALGHAQVPPNHRTFSQGFGTLYLELTVFVGGLDSGKNEVWKDAGKLYITEHGAVLMSDGAIAHINLQGEPLAMVQGLLKRIVSIVLSSRGTIGPILMQE